jgi:6-phosphogluconolactonase
MTETQNKVSANPIVYAGCYTQRGETKGESIFVYRLDMSSGALIYDSAVYGGENVSYLAISPDNRYMVAVNETVTFEGQPGGGVAALSIDPATRHLTLLNQQRSHGGLPCYASIDAKGRVALVSNYLGGNVALLPILADGRLGPATDIVQHSGSSVHPERQRSPYAHSIVIDPTNRFALVSDLGIDKVMIYKIDYENLKLIAHSHADVIPGAGPRHLTFHPNGRWAYLIHELDAHISVFAYDSESGTLKTLQTVPTMPEDYMGENTSADIHLSPSGMFVYGSNRGHDSITAFAIDPQTGMLTFVDRHTSGGKTPRNFAIDPTGSFLLAANQDTSDIVTFRLDKATGKMIDTGQVVKVYKPVCLKFLN